MPVFNLSLSLDASSWAWGFDAVLPAKAEALVTGSASGPVELVASVNGTSFRVLAESISRERIEHRLYFFLRADAIFRLHGLTVFRRSISVIGCCGDSWKP